MMRIEDQPFVTTEECEDLARLMERKYGAFLDGRAFAAEVSRDNLGVYAKVTLRNPSGSFFYPVEARMAHIDNDLNIRDGGLLLLDSIDSYFAEYLREGGDVYLPIDWADYDCDGTPIQMKGQILNLEIERLADEWLARAPFTQA